MKYNIVTVLNESYKDFGKLFVASAFENIDLNNVAKIYVFDVGLSEETKNYLEEFPRVEVVATEIKTESNNIHDEGWKKSTYSKTRFLLDVLIRDGIPTVMVDSDCIFVREFWDILEFGDFDIVATGRTRQGFSKHIGSFFAANNASKKTLSFMQRWIDNLEELQKNQNIKHAESPALSKTIEEMKSELEILVVPERVVSAIGLFPESRILHLKSDHYAKTIQERLSLPYAQYFVKAYLRT